MVWPVCVTGRADVRCGGGMLVGGGTVPMAAGAVTWGRRAVCWICVGPVPVPGGQAVRVARTAIRCQAATPVTPSPDEAPGRTLAG
jgi:hypothetical protein